MQESLAANQKSEKPEMTATAQKSGKGWLVCSIVLLVLLIGVCAFGGMIIAKGNRDTNRLSEVEAELKEKQAKIEELENQADKTPAEATDDSISVDIDTVKEIIAADAKLPAEDISLNGTIIMTQGEQKNIVLGTSVGTKGSGFYAIYYKENTSGSEWKKVSHHHQLTCSSLSADKAAILKDLFYCVNEDSEMEVVGYN